MSPAQKQSEPAKEVDRQNRKDSQDQHVRRRSRRAEASEPHGSGAVKRQEYKEALWLPPDPLVGQRAKFSIDVRSDESSQVEPLDKSHKTRALLVGIVSARR